MGRPSTDLDEYLDWQERLESFQASGLEVGCRQRPEWQRFSLNAAVH